MKKLNYLLFTILSIVLFMACKPKEKLVGKNEKQTNDKQFVANDIVSSAKTNSSIAVENTGISGSLAGNEKETALNDTIVPALIITDADLGYDPDPPVETPLTSSIPEIITELFPEYEWKLFVADEGYTKYYTTQVGNRVYGYSVLNDLVASKYKKGEISDEQLIKLYISLLFHPYDPNLEILTTKHEENTMHLSFNKFRSSPTYNYKTIIIYKGEQVEFYSFVTDNKYLGCIAVENGRMIKQLSVN